MARLNICTIRDIALYEGFLGDADHRLVSKVRNSTPQELAQNKFDFKDKRLPGCGERMKVTQMPSDYWMK